MKGFYFKTFSKIAILPYIGGTILHILRLIYYFPIEEMPYEVDVVVVLFGSYACFGFMFFIRQIKFSNTLEKILHALVIIHLGGSAVMHGYSLIVQNHNWARVFPLWYSYTAVFYFTVLGLYCVRLNHKLNISK